MARRPETISKDPADTEPAENDPAPDAVTPDDPIVEAIEEEGEPSGGNFA